MNIIHAEDKYANRRVRIKKNQPVLGGDRYPGRFGTVVRIHPFLKPQPLLYIQLDPTSRAKGREEVFWLSCLIFLDE
jgi:hypothetical protein